MRIKSVFIYQNDVLVALDYFEFKLFGCTSNEKSVPKRLEDVFVKAYILNSYPEESDLLIRSYKLLQSSGCYYNQKGGGW